MPEILFQVPVGAIQLPGRRPALRQWLVSVAGSQGRRIKALSIVLMDDEALLVMNREYLDHDDYTDIITFDHTEEAGGDGDDAALLPIEGDLCISWERVADNAAARGLPASQELLRVMAHGVLHLCGLGDKAPEDIAQMRAAEEEALELWAAIEARQKA